MTLYQRVMAAARTHAGVRLSADDVMELARVDEIRLRAIQDDEACLDLPATDSDGGDYPPGWNDVPIPTKGQALP